MPYDVRFSIGVVNSRSETPQKEYKDDTSALTCATPYKNKHIQADQSQLGVEFGGYHSDS